MTGKFKEPIGVHLLCAIAGDITDLSATGNGVIAYPGIEADIGQSTITYTDNSKTITSIAADRLSFVVSANTNLFVGQCISLSTGDNLQYAVITEIDGTTISVDRKIIAGVVATDAVKESIYYSVYRMDRDAINTDTTAGNHRWKDYAKYFYIEVKGDLSYGQLDLIFPNSINIADYYADNNISTKPISMVKANNNNAAGGIYVFKPF